MLRSASPIAAGLTEWRGQHGRSCSAFHRFRHAAHGVAVLAAGQITTFHTISAMLGEVVLGSGVSGQTRP